MNVGDGVWPIAGMTAPKVRPPTIAAPLFRSSLRSRRLEPIGLSFADETTYTSLPRGRSIRPARAGGHALTVLLRRGLARLRGCPVLCRRRAQPARAGRMAGYSPPVAG